MARKPFVVLDAEILSSSVWAEAAHIRLVWITLLILCDTEGYVGAAVPGIARAAGVTLQEAEDAIAHLQSPDKHSRTRSSEGRRLEVAERGFRVLNFLEHVDRLSSERVKSRERVRRFRERRAKKEQLRNVTVTAGNVTVRPENREQGTENREERTTETETAPLVVQETGNGALQTSVQDYGKEVWAEFVAKRGSDLPLASTKEWSLIRKWFDQGLPLRAVVTGLKDCTGSGRSLLYYGPAIEDEAQRLAKMRVGS